MGRGAFTHIIRPLECPGEIWATQRVFFIIIITGRSWSLPRRQCRSSPLSLKRVFPLRLFDTLNELCFSSPKGSLGYDTVCVPSCLGYVTVPMGCHRFSRWLVISQRDATLWPIAPGCGRRIGHHRIGKLRGRIQDLGGRSMYRHRVFQQRHLVHELIFACSPPPPPRSQINHTILTQDQWCACEQSSSGGRPAARRSLRASVLLDEFGWLRGDSPCSRNP